MKKEREWVFFLLKKKEAKKTLGHKGKEYMIVFSLSEAAKERERSKESLQTKKKGYILKQGGKGSGK